MNSARSSPARRQMKTVCADLQDSPSDSLAPLLLSYCANTAKSLPAGDTQWDADIFNGHAIGCNAVSWAPAVVPGSLITLQQPPTAAPDQPPQALVVKRFAIVGCNNLIKIRGYREDSQSWVEEETLEGHTDWIRDVAWAPDIGLPRSYIATASQDKSVLIWTKDGPTAPWVKTALDPGIALASPAGCAGARWQDP